MPDTVFSQYAALGAAPANGDKFLVCDVSDTSMAETGTTKHVLWSEIITGLDALFLTPAEGNAAYEAAGAVAAHVAAGDPHPQYLTAAEGNAAYSALGHTHDHGAITGLTDDDHTQYVLADGSRAISGTLIVRQSGGVAGTDEVQTIHDGTDGFIVSKSGLLRLQGDAGVRVETGAGSPQNLYAMRLILWNGSAGTIFLNQDSGGVSEFSKDGQYGWNAFSSAGNGNDTGLARLAAASVKATNGSTGYGALTSGATDAVTNATSTVLTTGHNSSGTPAAGFGSTRSYLLASSTTVDQQAAAVDVLWATATHATRKARWVLSVYDTAAREVIRGEASGSAPMVGFLGAAAVIRQAVSGARDDPEAALANLLTALATLGLITDNTTAS